MVLTTILLYAAGALLFLWILRYLLVIQELVGMTLKTPEIGLVERAEIPVYQETLFTIKEKEIQELGFRFSYAYSVKDMFSSPKIDRYGLTFFHHEKKTFVHLTLSGDLNPYAPFTVSFVTFLQDDTRIETVNGTKHLLIAVPPHITIEDAYAETLQKQWEFHQLRLTRCSENEIKDFQGSSEEIEERIASTNRAFRELMTNLLIDGKIVTNAQNSFRIKIRSAWRLAHQMLQGHTRTQALRKKTRAMYKPLEIPAELEVEKYDQQEYVLEQKKRHPAGKAFTLLVSMVLFILAFKYILDIEWNFILILLLLLFFHEGGHLLAMRLSGYKNLSMLFIPLLGAVAIGSEKRIQPHKKVITLFAGPVPGILLALTLLFFNRGGIFLHSPFMGQLIIFLLFLNYFNLIPVLPLDGGQILNTVIFSRRPLLEWIFVIFSMAGLVGLALWLDAPRLLFVTLIIPLAYSGHATKRRLLRQIQSCFPNPDELKDKDVVAKAFSLLKNSRKSLSFPRKFQIVRYIEENIFIPRPTMPTTVITLLVYSALVSLPIISLLFPNIPMQILMGRPVINANPCAAIQKVTVPSGTIPEAARFGRIPFTSQKGFNLIAIRFCFLNKNMQELSPEYFLSKMWMLFGEPDMIPNGFSYTIQDKVSNTVFKALVQNLVTEYQGKKKDEKTIQSIHLFEKLLAETRLAECSLELEVDFSKHYEKEELPEGAPRIRYRIGCKNGKPFMESIPTGAPPLSPGKPLLEKKE